MRKRRENPLRFSLRSTFAAAEFLPLNQALTAHPIACRWQRMLPIFKYQHEKPGITGIFSIIYISKLPA
jgi:hypothetical protein